MASDKSPSGKPELESRSRAPRRYDVDDSAAPTRMVRRTASGDQILLTGMLGAGGGLETKPAVTRPYEENEWVHACVKVKGQAVSSVPLVIWLGEPGKDKNATPLPPNDPISRLFARPMPYMTGAQFFEAGAHHRALDGEDFWFLLDANGNPLQASARIPMPKYILPVRGRSVTLERDVKTGWPKTWHASSGSRPEIVAPAQSVIQFRDYNADDPLRGLGDGEALANVIDMTWQAWRYQRAILKNSGDPGGFIKTEQPLAPDEAEAAENEAAELYALQNAGRWKVVSGKGLTFEPNKLGPRDMDFKAMHPWNRDVILANFGVPPPIVGVMEYATLANFVECVRMFWQGGNGVLAYLRTIEDVITNLFLRDLQHPQADKLYARFDTSGVEALQEDRNLQLDIAVKLAQANLGINFVEACALVGVEVDKDALQYAKEHFINAGVTTVDAALEMAKYLSDPGLDDEEDPPDDDEDPPEDGDADSNDDEEEPADDEAEKPAEALTREEEPDPAEVARLDRRAYWSTKEIGLLRGGERVLRSRYRGWRKGYEREQLKRLRDFASDGHAALRIAAPVQRADDGPLDDLNPSTFNVDDLLLPKAEQAARMRRRFTDPVHGIYANALEDLAQELGIEFPLLPSDPSVLAALDAQLSKLVDGHVDFLADRVRDALKQTLSKATNQADLQAAVNEVLPDLTEELRRVFGDRATRANLIARDQTASAVNQARDMEMIHTGVAEFEFITQHDAAVRGNPAGAYPDSEFSHFELDGKTWAAGTLIDPQRHPGLKFPKDPDGEPGDVIGCRCLHRPVLKKETNQ